jgi:hypothetical protein
MIRGSEGVATLIRWFRGHQEEELSEWAWVKSAHECIELLASAEVEEVSLDYDLGDPDEVGTGYDVLLWVEERAAKDDQFLPPLIHIHSSNVPGRQRMELALVGISRIIQRRTD